MEPKNIEVPKLATPATKDNRPLFLTPIKGLCLTDSSAKVVLPTTPTPNTAIADTKPVKQALINCFFGIVAFAKPPKNP